MADRVRIACAASKALTSVLGRFPCPDGERHTHTSFAGGRYRVREPAERAELMDAYCAALDAGRKDLFLVERPDAAAMPLLVDLDFRLAGRHGRRYDSETVTDFLQAYSRCAGAYLDCDSYLWYVLEKPGPRPGGSAGAFKDGLHYVCPGVVASAAVQLAIRADFLSCEYAEGFFEGLSDSPADGVYDKSVLGTNGWMMYGSRKVKDDPDPWVATRTVQMRLEDGHWRSRATLLDRAEQGQGQGPPSEIARLLAVHREPCDLTPLTDAGARVRGPRPPRPPAAAPAPRSRGAVPSGGALADAPPAAVPDHVTSTLARLVSCIGAGDADDRHTWMCVGIFLKSLGVSTGMPDRYLETFLEFSRKSASKFGSEGACMSDWGSFCRSALPPGRRPLTIGTLVALALKGAGAKGEGMPTTAEVAAAAAFFERPIGPQASAGSLSAAPPPDSPDNPGGGAAAPDDLNRRAIVDALRGLGLDPLAAGITGLTVTRDGIAFKCGAVEGVVRPDYRVMADGTDLGLLFGEFQVPHSLAFVHDHIPPESRFVCKMDSDEHATLKGNPPHADRQVVLHNIRDPGACFASVSAPRKGEVTVDSRSKISRLLKVFGTVRADHARSVYGITNNTFMCVNIAGDVNNNYGQVGGSRQAREEAFEHIRDAMLRESVARGLRKAGEVVFAPVEGTPCGFAPLCSYEDYVGEVLRGDRVYLANPRRHEEALKFLRSYRKLDEFPEFEPDRDLMSFSDGVLHLPDAVFYAAEAAASEPRLAGRAARHHIPMPFCGAEGTPMLDRVLDAQFDADAKQLLLAMIGRLLFCVGQLDGFEVMPYLVGIGGTGKSLILSVVKAMFAPGTVGNLSPRREEVFGMANIADKHVVIGRDMPERLSGVLPQEYMQLMTSGEDIEVPRKGQLALNVTWSAPTILASNHLPDYVNTGNNVGRRLVTFRFDNPTTNTDEGLLGRILESELPAVVRRALSAYHELRAKAAAAGGFWRAAPETVLKWQSKLAEATNKLYAFLSSEDAKRGCKVECVSGAMTPLNDLEEAFTRATGGALAMDVAVLAQFGFSLSQTKVNVCKTCKKVAKGGREGVRCCAGYAQGNRDKKTVVYNMALTAVDGVDDDL